MRDLLRHVGSAHNLVVFEAAARLGSFSKAAEELGLTQPAVSQAVRRLETAIGTRLFQRSHRAITLTDSGDRLYADVADGFTRILATARQIRRAAHGEHATLIVSTAFATWWMVPRLAAFRARHPHVDLRLETRDKDVDIAAEATTLAVRRGTPDWPGYQSAPITSERLMTVASPKLLASRPRPASIRDLLDFPLVHLDEPHRIRPSLADFFQNFGVRFRDGGDGLRLNDYALVLQAAMAGEGLALGWAHICELPIEQGLLAQVGPWTWETGERFHLVWSATTPLTENARLVRDWILTTPQRPGR
jgi:DNA-binding transcriptional LysR family regulator